MGKCVPGKSKAPGWSGNPLNYDLGMYSLFPDTHPEVEQLQIDLLREAQPWRKLEMVWEMNLALRMLLVSGLQSQHPVDPPDVTRRRLAEPLAVTMQVIDVLNSLGMR